MVGEIESSFPKLQTAAYHITSPATRDYNCIAWAAGDSRRWWWPEDDPDFADADSIPTHAARQLPNGRWTSKLGFLEDIEHDLHDVAGEAYGTVVVLLKRPMLPASGSAPAS